MDPNDKYIHDIIKQHEHMREKYIEDMDVAERLIGEIIIEIVVKGIITTGKKTNNQFMKKHLTGCNSSDDFFLRLKNMSNKESDTLGEIFYRYTKLYKREQKKSFKV